MYDIRNIRQVLQILGNQEFQDVQPRSSMPWSQHMSESHWTEFGRTKRALFQKCVRAPKNPGPTRAQGARRPWSQMGWAGPGQTTL